MSRDIYGCYKLVTWWLGDNMGGSRGVEWNEGRLLPSVVRGRGPCYHPTFKGHPHRRMMQPPTSAVPMLRNPTLDIQLTWTLHLQYPCLHILIWWSHYWLEDSETLSSTFCNFSKSSLSFFLSIESTLNGYKDSNNTKNVKIFFHIDISFWAKAVRWCWKPVSTSIIKFPEGTRNTPCSWKDAINTYRGCVFYFSMYISSKKGSGEFSFLWTWVRAGVIYWVFQELQSRHWEKWSLCLETDESNSEHNDEAFMRIIILKADHSPNSNT